MSLDREEMQDAHERICALHTTKASSMQRSTDGIGDTKVKSNFPNPTLSILEMQHNVKPEKSTWEKGSFRGVHGRENLQRSKTNSNSTISI